MHVEPAAGGAQAEPGQHCPQEGPLIYSGHVTIIPSSPNKRISMISQRLEESGRADGLVKGGSRSNTVAMRE
jgi:hypothetical protein